MRVVLALLLLLAACTHRYPLSRLPHDDLTGKKVKVTTEGGTVTARAVPTATGVELVAVADGRVIPWTEVRSLEVKNASRGMWPGFGAGAVLGVIAGVVAHNRSIERCEDADGENCGDAPFGSIPSVVAYSALGGLTGLLVGAIVGVDEHYEAP